MRLNTTRYLILLMATCTMWSAFACLGMVGEPIGPGQPPPSRRVPTTPADGGKSTPPDNTLPKDDPSPRDTQPDTTKVQDRQPDTAPDKAAPDKGGDGLVYYAEMKPFLDKFCGNACHSPGANLTDLSKYDLPARRRKAKDVWAQAHDFVRGNGKLMPPGGIDKIAETDKPLFTAGVALFEKWAQNNYAKRGYVEARKDEDPNIKFPSSANCFGRDPLPARLWRLTPQQIVNSINDTFKDYTIASYYVGQMYQLSRLDSKAKQSLLGYGLENNWKNYIGSVDLLQLTGLFRVFASGIVRTNEVRSCERGQGNTCAEALLKKYGALLWRRPLTNQEVQTTMSRFATIVSTAEQSYPGTGRNTGLVFLFERLFLSPYFLFRLEVGTPEPGRSNIRRLNSYEIAGWLASLVWQSAPDQTLLDAASRGELGTLAQVQAQLKRMMTDPRAHRGINDFITDWLDIDLLRVATRDGSIYPDFKQRADFDKYKAALQGSIKAFLEHHVWGQSATLDALFTTNEYFMNNVTAKYYGQSVADTKFVKKTLNGSERVGILSSLAYLVSISGNFNTDYVHRSVFFIRNVICDEIPEPDANIMNAISELNRKTAEEKKNQKLTTRDAFAKFHSGQAACEGCHKYIDPVGNAFEIFDSIGRFRTTQADANNQKIDASGKLQLKDETQQIISFLNAPDLIKKVVNTQHFKRCFVKKWYAFSSGAEPDTSRTCALAKLYDNFAGAKFTLKDAYEVLLQADAETLFLRKEPTVKP